MLPSPRSSLYYKFSFFKFLFTCKYFYRLGPIEHFMKFLLRSKDSMWIALWRTYYAPCVLIKFYDIFSYFNILFHLRGIEIISAPFIPISLSYNFKHYNVLFCNNTAARHLAPSIPNEFFLIEPSIIPKSKDFKLTFLINSYKIKDNPT